MAIFSYDKEKVVSAMKDMLSATDILKDTQAEITKGYNMITSARGSKYIKADINSINNITESISESIEEVTEVIREKAEEIENYNEYQESGISLVIPFEMWLKYKKNKDDETNEEDDENLLSKALGLFKSVGATVITGAKTLVSGTTEVGKKAVNTLSSVGEFLFKTGGKILKGAASAVLSILRFKAKIAVNIFETTIKVGTTIAKGFVSGVSSVLSGNIGTVILKSALFCSGLILNPILTIGLVTAKGVYDNLTKDKNSVYQQQNNQQPTEFNNNDLNNSEDKKNSSNLENETKEDINDNLSDTDSNDNKNTIVSNSQTDSSSSSKNILTTNTDKNKNKFQAKPETLEQELKDTTNQENLQQEIDDINNTINQTKTDKLEKVQQELEDINKKLDKLNNKINEDSTFTTTISDNQQSSNTNPQTTTNVETTQNIPIQQQSYIPNNNEYNSSSITEPIVETPKDTEQSTQSVEPSSTEIEPSEGSITRIPAVEESSATSTSSSGNSVIPIATGVAAAVAAGIGTKIYFDKKKENEDEGEIVDEEDESSELYESSIIESDYDNSTTEDETTTSLDEYSYKIEPSEEVEHYNARTEKDLANLQ